MVVVFPKVRFSMLNVCARGHFLTCVSFVATYLLSLLSAPGEAPIASGVKSNVQGKAETMAGRLGSNWQCWEGRGKEGRNKIGMESDPCGKPLWSCQCAPLSTSTACSACSLTQTESTTSVESVDARSQHIKGSKERCLFGQNTRCESFG